MLANAPKSLRSSQNLAVLDMGILSAMSCVDHIYGETLRMHEADLNMRFSRP